MVQPRIEVVEIGMAGPQGPQGPAGSGGQVSYVKNGNTNVIAEGVDRLNFVQSDFNVVLYGTTQVDISTVKRPRGFAFRSGAMFGPLSTGAGIGGTSVTTSIQAISGTFLFNAVPFYVPVATTIDQVTVPIGAALAGASVIAGLYATSATGEPTTKIAALGTVSAATTGNKTIALGSQIALTGDTWYVIVLNIDIV